jgi:hypothetical protein
MELTTVLPLLLTLTAIPTTRQAPLRGTDPASHADLLLERLCAAAEASPYCATVRDYFSPGQGAENASDPAVVPDPCQENECLDWQQARAALFNPVFKRIESQDDWELDALSGDEGSLWSRAGMTKWRGLIRSFPDSQQLSESTMAGLSLQILLSSWLESRASREEQTESDRRELLAVVISAIPSVFTMLGVLWYGFLEAKQRVKEARAQGSAKRTRKLAVELTRQSGGPGPGAEPVRHPTLPGPAQAGRVRWQADDPDQEGELLVHAPPARLEYRQ